MGGVTTPERDLAHVFEEDSLNPLLALGRRHWDGVRTWVTSLLSDPAERDLVEPNLVPVDEVTMHLPFAVADYVDFYCSLDHASNVGKILRRVLRDEKAKPEAQA